MDFALYIRVHLRNPCTANLFRANLFGANKFARNLADNAIVIRRFYSILRQAGMSLLD